MEATIRYLVKAGWELSFYHDPDGPAKARFVVAGSLNGTLHNGFGPTLRAALRDLSRKIHETED